MSNNLLTQEESQHKDEIIDLTEQVTLNVDPEQIIEEEEKRQPHSVEDE